MKSTVFSARVPLVLGGHPDVDAAALQGLLGVGRVVPAALHVDEEVVLLVAHLRLAHVRRIAGVGVVGAGGEHAADLHVGIDLVRDLGRPGARHELVVGGAVLRGIPVLALLEHQARSHERQVQDHVDLVEGKPVPHQALVAGEQHRHELPVEVDERAVAPAAVLLDEIDGAVEMCDGHERLDAVLPALAEQVLVEGQAFLVGLRLVAVGEDAAPADGQAVGLEAHLGEQRDVLLVAVVHVDGGLCRVVIAVLEIEHLALSGHDRPACLAVRDHIDVGQAAATLVVRALALVGGRRAAPQEPIRKAH